MSVSSYDSYSPKMPSGVLVFILIFIGTVMLTASMDHGTTEISCDPSIAECHESKLDD